MARPAGLEPATFGLENPSRGDRHDRRKSLPRQGNDMRLQDLRLDWQCERALPGGNQVALGRTHEGALGGAQDCAPGPSDWESDGGGRSETPAGQGRLVPDDLVGEILGGTVTESRDPRLVKLNLQSENALTREASPSGGARPKGTSSLESVKRVGQGLFLLGALGKAADRDIPPVGRPDLPGMVPRARPAVWETVLSGSRGMPHLQGSQP